MGVPFALFCLLAMFAPAAHAMVLELDFYWSAQNAAALKETYHLQEGSVIQVIAMRKEPDTAAWSNTAGGQFALFGQTGEEAVAEPYTTADPDWANHVITIPEGKTADVYLANTTAKGHDIVYTGTLGVDEGDYCLYHQITIDQDLYDKVYVRIFGTTDLREGEVVASYWGVSTTTTLDPDAFYFQTLELRDNDLTAANLKNYFEVIPEPATLGLLGIGGCALAAWRRRRPHSSVPGSERQEENR